MKTIKKYAATLAKEYDFTTDTEYFDYIVDSLINGDRAQVRQLFNKMHNSDKENFLINYLDKTQGYHISTLNICIGELCK
jgi:hypothetical protein